MTLTTDQLQILKELNITFLAEEPDTTVTDNAMNTFFVLMSGYLVFFMQAGFAMLCAGSVRSKNAKNIMLKNFLDACFGALGFWAVGYGVAYGTDAGGFIGTDLFFLSGYEEGGNGYHSWFYQFAFAATAATIVSGAVAERTQMVAYIFYAMFLTGFVYPIVAHWIWSGDGWLSAFNANSAFKVLDFAGCGVVHMTGGISALIGAWAVGPRIGRFNVEDGSVNSIPGHNTVLAVLGTFILWFGWYGFNPGSMLAITGDSHLVVAKSAVTTTMSAVAGAMTALVYYNITERNWDLTMSLNGALAGLVAITSSCSVVDPWAAVVIGAIGAIIYALSSKLVSHVLRIDDVVDAAPVHFFCGMWGLIAPALFATPANLKAAYGFDTGYGLLYGGGADTLVAQLVAIVAIIAWVVVLMTPFFVALNKMGVLRASEDDEMMGLDVSHHGGAAYPELNVKVIGDEAGTDAEKASMTEMTSV